MLTIALIVVIGFNVLSIVMAIAAYLYGMKVAMDSERIGNEMADTRRYVEQKQKQYYDLLKAASKEES